ncbi:hypothetical protein GCM10011584_31060 [Nocardioides phosphati]|uniref:DUF389 domain-containing protein n=1 Tax=Nocardioides phosphati TaxID=1867775 RepID=A0ABQ2NEQ9_9ACTN|nr:DUF389 domain-containing protein [Nocardioides phosphati]GGO93102.1 hypothetical protein GCM10011584_31060 [Nocardioides phosphati]
MLHLRIVAPAASSPAVLALLRADPSISSLTAVPGASLLPEGDLIEADLPREAANEIVEALRALGVHRSGTLHLEPVRTWVSRSGFDAERRTPGSGADAVVWADVVQQAYEDSELNWIFLTFMSLATVLAGIAIVLDSQILVIGAMVLGPEFGAVAALGVAFVRGRGTLLLAASRALVIGFAVAIAVTGLLALVARGAGWITLAQVTAPRPATGFVYEPDHWSIVVALIAAAAGVLSVTSSRVGGLSGVFISVTTIPAAGNIALGLAFWVPAEITGSLLQLGLNLVGMAAAGWLTLGVQERVWQRFSIHRARMLDARRRADVYDD